jgi:hypothetical protein
MANGQAKKVFISYSWDGDTHKQWVRDFAIRLRRDGLEVILDQWNTGLGDRLTRFMEWAVRESDYVLCICTPRYKEKSDSQNGGVGYEGYIMTAEFFHNPDQRKFIPVLRMGEWIEVAPSWLLGIIYVDLRDNLYSGRNYEELLSMLKGDHPSGPPDNHLRNIDEEISGFVNRKIELATLDPLKNLPTSYWQCALISAPAGYGKSWLLDHLVEEIRKDPEAFARWNWRHVNMSKCDAPSRKIAYFWEQVCNRPFESDLDLKSARKQVCEHILENLSLHPKNGSSCGVLILIDSLEDLTPETEEWLFGVFNEVVTGSYTDYAKGQASFPVRLILAGRDIEAFWSRYRRWEKESGRRYYLRSENLLVLSAFKKKDVEDLIDRKQKIARLLDVQLDVSVAAERLLYLSGGHPAVINGILDELIRRRFRGLDDYLGQNIEQLIRNHISEVVRQIFKNYTPEQQMDIKTVLVFRMVTLDTLARLRAGGLIFWKDDNATLIGFLCGNQFLHYERKMSCYRDDILRRISYLDFAYATCEHTAHIQAVHKCALEHYETLIEQSGEQKSAYFVEWLFHALQVADVLKEETALRWKSLLSHIRPGAVLPADLKKDVEEEFQNDIEIRHLCHRLFGSEDVSLLLEN